MGQGSHLSKIALVFLLAFSAIGVAAYYYLLSLANGYGTYATFPNGEKIALTIMRTDEERSRGLSGRESMRNDEGMYFTFPGEDRYGFWMKGMNFPIDIFWISKGKIIAISENVSPEPGVPDEKLKIYYPPEPVGSVLEMNAGTARREGVHPGDSFKLEIISNK